MLLGPYRAQIGAHTGMRPVSDWGAYWDDTGIRLGGHTGMRLRLHTRINLEATLGSDWGCTALSLGAHTGGTRRGLYWECTGTTLGVDGA